MATQPPRLKLVTRVAYLCTMNMIPCTRRTFIFMASSLTAGAMLQPHARAATPELHGSRRYHVCLSSKVIAAEPELLQTVQAAGVTDVWLAAYFYGQWYETPEGLRVAIRQLELAGLRWHLINLPLGHPGDSLGDPAASTPLSPSGPWRMAERPDGTRYAGTSLHVPANQDNVAALRELTSLEPDIVFLDDDFRLATGPGVIGGCYCSEHKQRFLNHTGRTDADWSQLLIDVAERNLSPVLRAWVDFTCDELTDSFHQQQAALPNAALGNMIMYLGAEKAGIRLKDYREVPFRVGELMFDDRSFSSVKGKCNELFSALFHRRFAKRELAYSETTAYPHDQLSAKNLAAKLVVSTLSDVPNTMFMSGLTPYPIAHWQTLGPAMGQQARLHERVAGHIPRGPLKHYWGEAMRYVGDDRPYSLFLALGIPFEVANTLPDSGITFLGDQDARHLAGLPDSGQFVCRPNLQGLSVGVRAIEESLDALQTIKRELTQGAVEFPYIVEESPAICAWYPSANGVVVWNLNESPVTLTLRFRGSDKPLNLEALEAKFSSLLHFN